MVVLAEQIDIPAPFERLCEWVDNFEEEFVRWSPYHLERELFDGGVEKGDRVRFYEIVMGLDYDVTGTITKSERDDEHFLFEFENDKKTAIITFDGRRIGSGCRFSHTEAFGSRLPVIGPIINFLVFKVFYRKYCDWQLIRDDMVLDNHLLADILTSGTYPERIPLSDLRATDKKAQK